MKNKIIVLIVILFIQINCLPQDSKLRLTAKANAGTSSQNNNDLIVVNGANSLDLSSPTISCISSTNSHKQIYKISIEDDYDQNGVINQITFDLIVAAHMNSTYSFNENENSSSLTKIGVASEVSIINNVWGIDNDGDIDAGETIIFTIENLSLSNLSNRYKAVFDGFNILGLHETNGGNNHRIIKGEGSNLSSYTINFSKDFIVDNEESIILTGAGSAVTEEIREWGLSSIGFSISIKDSQSTGIDDLSDYSLFSNASNFGGPYPSQTKTVNKSQFCWDKIPRWLAVRNVDPLTDEEVNDLAEHYQIVLLEKANNQGEEYVEDGMVSLATRLKAKNPDITTLFYWNSWINYGGYKANEGYDPNVNSWSDLDSNGTPILFKDLYYTYNYDVKALRDWWIKTPIDAMKNDVIDGVFVDKVVYGAFKEIFPNGKPINNYVRMLSDLYDAMPEGKMVIGNVLRTERTNSNRALMEVMDGSYLERWAFPGTALNEAEAIAISIQSMREALSKGKVIHFQTSPHDTGGEEPSDYVGKVQYAKDNINFPLAVYLIIAEEGAYFSYQSQVNARKSAQEVWNTSFIDEFSYKLGPPLGPPTKDGYIYQRSYENVDVWVNVDSKEARLDWKDKTKITTTECSEAVCRDFDAFATIEAEDYCDQRGIKTEISSEGGENVGYINNGDWIKFNDVNFGNGASSVDVRVASISSGGTIEFRLGSESGPLVGTALVPNTGGWQNWETISATISDVDDIQDLYLVFTKGFNLNWIKFIKNSVTPISDGKLVHITKRNATEFAIDGGTGGANGQNVTLSAVNTADEGQLWIEIDRENGYYSYEKYGTNYSLDGKGGGIKNQSVYIWKTSATNQNQQWQKIAIEDGSFKLIKRNASEFAINGGSGGVEGRDLNLWNSSSSSQNLQWYITPIATDIRSENDKELTNNLLDITVYPNPITTTATIHNAANSILNVYDINGKIIFTQIISTDSETINLNRMITGIYYGEIVGERSKVVVKLVKQ